MAMPILKYPCLQTQKFGLHMLFVMKYSCFYLVYLYLCVCMCACVWCVCVRICVYKCSFGACAYGNQRRCLALFALFPRDSPICWGTSVHGWQCLKTEVLAIWTLTCWVISLTHCCLFVCFFVCFYLKTYMLSIAYSLPKQAVSHIKLVGARLPIPSVSHLACHFLPVQPGSLYPLNFGGLTINNK